MNEEKKTKFYNPPKWQLDIVSYVVERYEAARTMRNQEYRYFNDRSFEEYIQDSVDRWNGYIEPRDDPASDWGAKVFNNVTRNKTISIVAQVTAERLKGEFFAQSDDDPEDQAAADLAKALNDHAAYINRDEEQQFLATLEAAVKGTVVGYEGWVVDKRKVKYVKDYDPESGEIDYEEKEITDWNDVYSEIIPLLDVYVGNIYEANIQKQPFIVWRTVMPHTSFMERFGGYKNAKYVHGGGDLHEDDLYKELVSQDIVEEEVEVIRYFSKYNDEMHIVANGVLLTERISPFPWNHKQYPFWSSVFEPMAIDFFYGKSLPDKLRSDQDVLNTTYRMLLDQSWLSINRPILTTSTEMVQDEYLYPGRRIQVDDVNNTKELEIAAPNSAQFQILKLVQDSMREASVDNPSQGVSGSNSTAFEVSVAREAAVKLLALFLRTLEWGVQQKMTLRLKNQIQFYQIDLVDELGEETSAVFRQIRVPNATLPDSTQGTEIINVVDSNEDIPGREALDMRELDFLRRGQNVGIVYVSKEFLDSIDVKVHIVPNSSIKMSEALKRALEVDYQQKANLLYPDLVNRQEHFKELIEVYEKDPNKLMTVNQGMIPAPGSPEGGNQPNQNAGVTPNQLQGVAGASEANLGTNEILNSGRGTLREGLGNG